MEITDQSAGAFWQVFVFPVAQSSRSHRSLQAPRRRFPTRFLIRRGGLTLDLTLALRPVEMGSAAQLSGFVTVSNPLDRRFIGSAYTNPDIVNGAAVAYEPGAPRSVVISLSISKGK